MSLLFFFFALTVIFSGASGWAFWQWRSGRKLEQPLWLRAFHYCLLFAAVALLALLMDFVAMGYHTRN